MFGIGFSELILIFVVALLVLGPKRLPEVAKTLGRFYREIRSTVDEVKSVVTNEETHYQHPHHHIPPQTTSKKTEKDSWEDEFDKEIKETSAKKEEYQPKREKISFKKQNKIEEKSEEKDEPRA